MFDLGAGELLVIGVVALVAIGPKELPIAIRALGRTLGRIRGIASDFRHNLDVLAREAEMEKMTNRIAPQPQDDKAAPVMDDAGARKPKAGKSEAGKSEARKTETGEAGAGVEAAVPSVPAPKRARKPQSRKADPEQRS